KDLARAVTSRWQAWSTRNAPADPGSSAAGTTRTAAARERAISDACEQEPSCVDPLPAVGRAALSGAAVIVAFGVTTAISTCDGPNPPGELRWSAGPVEPRRPDRIPRPGGASAGRDPRQRLVERSEPRQLL